MTARDRMNERLSKISTIWSVLRQAQTGVPEAAALARQLLLERYGGAVHRYLLGALRDATAADDLTQELSDREFVRCAALWAISSQGLFAK